MYTGNKGSEAFKCKQCNCHIATLQRADTDNPDTGDIFKTLAKQELMHCMDKYGHLGKQPFQDKMRSRIGYNEQHVMNIKNEHTDDAPLQACQDHG